ncbi:arginine repressor, partial [Dysosmobacter welbionis]
AGTVCPGPAALCSVLFQQCFQPLEDHCRLGPGGGAGRIQRAVGPALEQSGRHRPGQGLPGIVRHSGAVGEAAQVRPARGIRSPVFRVPEQDGRQLLAGDPPLRAEGAVVKAPDDSLLFRPGHRIGAVAVRRHIGEGRRPRPGSALQSVED